MTAARREGSKRSSTGYDLLPATQLTGRQWEPVHPVQLLSWTLGRGAVIWRIWPAVLLHTIFAAAVVTVSLKTQYNLEIPNIMLTVIGVVLGFVISYRASSGYDRYWMGRTCWSDIIRNSRTIARLIWFHVPLRLSPKTLSEVEAAASDRPGTEIAQIMSEKRMALDLVEGFSVALKHHLRGELGIYYEDLYYLVRPLHDHDHSAGPSSWSTTFEQPRRPQRISSQPPLPQFQSSSPTPHIREFLDPVLPPINSYGTFDPSTSASPRPSVSRKRGSSSSLSSSSSEPTRHRRLLPAVLPAPETILGKVSSDLIPFSSVYAGFCRYFGGIDTADAILEGNSVEDSASHKWGGPVYSDRSHLGLRRVKHRPVVCGGGENIPLEVLHCLSEWFSVLEDRGTVPGSTMGALISYVANFEENLTALEKILTTPLPFVYSVHIRTVWLYLFFLPFQLVGQFQWYTVPGVAIAAFIYLGFLAAGEEIEQPFGYDDNDLDLDLFVQDIIHADITHIKSSPCLNAYLGPEHPQPVHRRSVTLVEASQSLGVQLAEPAEDLIGSMS